MLELCSYAACIILCPTLCWHNSPRPSRKVVTRRANCHLATKYQTVTVAQFTRTHFLKRSSSYKNDKSKRYCTNYQGIILHLLLQSRSCATVVWGLPHSSMGARPPHPMESTTDTGSNTVLHPFNLYANVSVLYSFTRCMSRETSLDV